MTEPTVILLRETTTQSVVRDLATCAVFVFLIGLGWLIDSSAMQWIGGFLAFLFTLARSSQVRKRATMTRAEALEALNKMEHKS